jgi:hypothetical protein
MATSSEATPRIVTGEESTVVSFEGEVIVIEGGVVSGPGGGGPTTTLTVADRTTPLAVPVIVTVYEPDVDPLRTQVAVPPPERVAGEHPPSTPVGDEATSRSIAPVNPFAG